jgi:hypothetical protein
LSPATVRTRPIGLAVFCQDNGDETLASGSDGQK